MEETNQKSGAGRVISVLMLMLLLVGLPMGSYIYLKQGYDYQKAALDDMRRSDRLTNHSDLQLVVGELPEVDLGITKLIGLVNTSDTEQLGQYQAVLSKLYEQFEALDNVAFWTVLPGQDSTSITGFAQAEDLPQAPDKLLYYTSDSYERFVKKLHLSEEELAYSQQHPMMVLVDDSLYVRRAFRIDVEADVKVLVERTALLAPERSRPKPELVRETEK